MRAPVFAEQLAKLDRSLLRRMKRIDFAAASTPGEFAHEFKRYSELIDAAVAGIDRLDPPLWAADQTARYQVALRDLQSVSQKFTTVLVAIAASRSASIDVAKYTRTREGAPQGRPARDQDAPEDAARGRRGADDAAGTRRRGRRAEPESEEQS